MCAHGLLDKAMRNEKFHAMAKDAVGVMGVTVEGVLIMPVQRIPRYKLLLEELLKVRWGFLREIILYFGVILCLIIICIVF